jgi:hypothetical protein
MNHHQRIILCGLAIAMTTFSCGVLRQQAEIKQRAIALALQGDVRQEIALLDGLTFRQAFPVMLRYRRMYRRRFLENEAPRPPTGSDSGAVGLLRIFQGYWREALMRASPDTVLEHKLMAGVSAYLQQQYPPAAKLSIKEIQEQIEPLYLGYLKSRGYHATEPGKTGNLYDLLVWAGQEQKDYMIELPGGVQNVRVVFMDKFLTLGWEEFATFGAAYPGGWTKSDALYCVKQAYQPDSEDFKVSYLTHEAQHFADNARYPKL